MFAKSRYLVALPALAFAVAALSLATGAFANGDVPRSRDIPTGEAASLKPSDLSPTVTARDWREVGGSGTKRGFK